MHEILPNLFLSNYKDATNAAKDRNFFVVNVTKDLPMIQPDGFRIPVNDDQTNETFVTFLQHLPVVMQAIKEQLHLGHTVVVHCLAGQQRSPAVIAAYLVHMKVCDTLEKAITFLRAKKPDAFFWSVNFKMPLQLWVGSANGRTEKENINGLES